MTTIFSDGNFLIADKKTTVTVDNKDARGGSTGKTSTIYLENCPKIIIPDEKVTCKIGLRGKAREVAALAFAGDSSYCHKVMTCVDKGYDLYDVMYLGGAFYAKDPGHVVAICKDGTTIRVASNKNATGTTTKATGARNGLILGAGSGFHTIEHALKNMNITKLSAMDAFTYAAFCDQFSNTRCDVYSLKENKLFTDVRIARQNVDKVLKLLRENTTFEKLLK